MGIRTNELPFPNSYWYWIAFWAKESNFASLVPRQSQQEPIRSFSTVPRAFSHAHSEFETGRNWRLVCAPGPASFLQPQPIFVRIWKRVSILSERILSSECKWA